MTDIYKDGTYFANNPTWDVAHSPWKARQIIEMLEKNTINPRTICEVGCGAGEILNQLSLFYSKEKMYFGYEISPQTYDLCRCKEKENMKFFLSDLLNNDSAYFDLILAIDIIEHIENYMDFLKKLKKKADYKLFHIPLELSVQSVLRVKAILSNRVKYGHINYFSKETLIETLKDTGFEIIDYFYTKCSLEFPGFGWKPKILNLGRRCMFELNEDITVRLLGGFSLLVLTK